MKEIEFVGLEKAKKNDIRVEREARKEKEGGTVRMQNTTWVSGSRGMDGLLWQIGSAVWSGHIPLQAVLHCKDTQSQRNTEKEYSSATCIRRPSLQTETSVPTCL